MNSEAYNDANALSDNPLKELETYDELDKATELQQTSYSSYDTNVYVDKDDVDEDSMKPITQTVENSITSSRQTTQFGSTYIRDADEVFVEADIVRHDDNDVTVRMANGDHCIVPFSECLNVPDYPPEGFEDMIAMNSLHEASILYNIRKRFEQDKIYTYTGGILISVNPFKETNLYTDEIKEKYKGKRLIDNEPHLYAIADQIYQSIQADEMDQAVVISGESGAGKTEATKIVLGYLALISQQACAEKVVEDEEWLVHERVLCTNPVLEAFGNAKTTQNDNSSRFGKLLSTQLNKKGEMVGAFFNSYLLEKNRVTYQNEGEMNFHVFYFLLASTDTLERDEWQLFDASQYRYLNQSGVASLPNVNAQEEYENLKISLFVSGIENAEQNDLFQLVASILHMGNILFSDDDEAQVENEDALNWTAYLLGCSAELLRNGLTRKTTVIRGEEFIVKLTQTEANDTRDSLAQNMYSNAFSWLISRLNKLMRVEEFNAQIQLLDIFGFEIFEHNSFEQLCINYANERLQLEFNEYVFKLEQMEYEKEGIDAGNISFSDNQPCIDLIEKPPMGILFLINEEANFPKASDASFLLKLKKSHKDHTQFVPDRFSGPTFHIAHYAGNVKYCVTGFLSKNREKFSIDLIKAINSSSFNFLHELFDARLRSAGFIDDEQSPRVRGTKKNEKTIALQFRDSMMSLCQTIQKCNPNFIRCVKSNSLKKAGLFENRLVNQQLCYLGALETIRIRKEGFSQRKTLDSFMSRYACLIKSIVPNTKTKSKLVEGSNDHTQTNEEKTMTSDCEMETNQPMSEANSVLGLLEALELDNSDDVKVGKEKIFIKENTYEILERKLNEMMSNAARVIQRTIRKFMVKQQLKRKRSAACILQAAFGVYLELSADPTDTIVEAILVLNNAYEGCIEHDEVTKALRTITSIMGKMEANKQLVVQLGALDALVDAIPQLIANPHDETLSAMLDTLIRIASADKKFAGDIARGLGSSLSDLLQIPDPKTADLLHVLVSNVPNLGVLLSQQSGTLFALRAGVDRAEESSLLTIKTLSERSGQAASSICHDKATIDCLIKTLNKGGFTKLIVYAVASLSALAKHKNNIDALVEADTIPSMIKALGEHSDSEDLTTSICDFYSNIIKLRPDQLQTLLTSGALESLLSTENLTPEVARLLNSLAVNSPEIRDLCVKHNLTQRALSAAAATDNNEDAAALLDLVVTAGTENLTSESLLALLSLLKQHENNQNAVKTLLDLISEVSTREDALEYLRDENAVEVVARAMELGAQNGATSDSARSSIQMFSSLIVEDDARQMLFAMQQSRHQGQFGVLRRQGEILSSMALVKDVVPVLIENGAIEELVALIQDVSHQRKNREQNAATISAAIRCLTRFLQHGDEHDDEHLAIVASTMASNAGDAVIRAVSSYGTSAPVLIAAFDWLATTARVGGMDQTAREELLNVLLQLSQNQVCSSAGLCKSMNEAVMVLVESGDNVAQSEWCEIVIQGMKSHTSNTEVMEGSIATLRTLLKGQAVGQGEKLILSSPQFCELLTSIQNEHEVEEMLLFCGEMLGQSNTLSNDVYENFQRALLTTCASLPFGSSASKAAMSVIARLSERIDLDTHCAFVASFMSCDEYLEEPSVGFSVLTDPNLIHFSKAGLTREFQRLRSANTQLSQLVLQEKDKTYIGTPTAQMRAQNRATAKEISSVAAQIQSSLELVARLVSDPELAAFAVTDKCRAIPVLNSTLHALVQAPNGDEVENAQQSLLLVLRVLGQNEPISELTSNDAMSDLVELLMKHTHDCMLSERGLNVIETLLKHTPDRQKLVVSQRIVHTIKNLQNKQIQESQVLPTQHKTTLRIMKTVCADEWSSSEAAVDQGAINLAADTSETLGYTTDSMLEALETVHSVLINDADTDEAKERARKVITAPVLKLSKAAMMHEFAEGDPNRERVKKLALNVMVQISQASEDDAAKISDDTELCTSLRKNLRGSLNEDATFVANGLAFLSSLGEMRRSREMGDLVGSNDDDDDDAQLLLFNMATLPRDREVQIAAVKALGKLRIAEGESNYSEECLQALQTVEQTFGDDEIIVSLVTHHMEKMFPKHLNELRAVVPMEISSTQMELAEFVLAMRSDELMAMSLEAPRRLHEVLEDDSLSLEVVCTSLKALTKLTELHDEQWNKAVWKSKTLRTLIRMLKTHIEFPNIAVWVVNAIGKLCVYEFARVLIGLHSGVRALLDVMKAYKDNDDQRVLLLCLCETLALCAFRTPANIKEIANYGGIELTIGVIEQHNELNELAVQGLSCLSNLCYNDEKNNLVIVKEGGGRCATQLLFTAVNDKRLGDQVALRLVEFSLRCICTLVSVSANADSLVSDNIDDPASLLLVLVDVSKKYMNKTSLSELVAEVIYALTSGSEACRERMCRQKCVHISVMMWRSHIKNITIMSALLKALHRLCTPPDSIAPALMLKVRGLDLLVQYADLLLQNETTSPLALTLLADLSISEVVVKAILKHDMVEKVVTSIHTFEENREIMFAGFHFIGSLAVVSNEVCRMVGNKGVLELPEEIMDLHDQTDVWTAAVRCWTYLSGHPDNAAEMAPICVDCVVVGMKRFSQNTVFLKTAVECLAALAIHSAGTRQLLGRGAVPSMLTCLASYPDSAALVVHVVRALLNMATIQASSVLVLVQQRAPILVKSVAKRQTNNQAVKKICARFLSVIADAQLVGSQLSNVRDQVEPLTLNMILAGHMFLQFCRSTKPRTRRIVVSPDCRYVHWSDPVVKAGKGPLARSIALCHISDVRPGACTFELKRKGMGIGARLAVPGRSFALFGRRQAKWNLSLEADTPEIAHRWIAAFEILIKLNDSRGARAVFNDS